MPATESTQIDENLYHLLAAFSKVARAENVPWMLVGATGRILLLEKVYGWPKGVATEDTDFAVQVDSWEHYDVLCKRLADLGVFRPMQKPAKRFATQYDLLFDLLPYGGVETGNKQVYWPPNNDDLMTVRGFGRAHRDAIIVNVNDTLDVPVASPRGLCALKLFAWEERSRQHPGRDAKDLAYLFQNIERLYPLEALHADYNEALEAADYDSELAGLYQLGAEVKALLEEDETEFLAEFLAKELAQEDDSVLVRDMYRYYSATDIERVINILKSFYQPLHS